MAVKVLVGMAVADAVLASAGSLEDLVAFCLLNGIGITDSLTPGEELQSTGLIYQASSTITNSQLTSAPVDVLPGQTIPDLAMQQLGSMEDFFALAVLNGLSVTAPLTPGLPLNYSLTPFSTQVVQFFKSTGFRPASGLNIPGPPPPALLSGIGYWGIGYDFIVS